MHLLEILEATEVIEKIRKDRNSGELKTFNGRKSQRRQTLLLQKLNNSPIAPRKMRLVADLIKGEEVNKALNILQHNAKDAAGSLEKLLRSALSNWEQKMKRKALKRKL